MCGLERSIICMTRSNPSNRRDLSFDRPFDLYPLFEDLVLLGKIRDVIFNIQIRNKDLIMWNSRPRCLSPGRMPSPQILDLIKFSFLSWRANGNCEH